MLQREVFKKYENLTLFSGILSLPEEDGHIFMVCRDKSRRRLTLNDTALNPDNLLGSTLKIEYRDFGEDTVLAIFFGKPYANEPSTTAELCVKISKSALFANGKAIKHETAESGSINIFFGEDAVTLNGEKFTLSKPPSGYTELFCESGNLDITAVEVNASAAPLSKSEHNARLIKWRHKQLDKKDIYLDRLEKYLKEHPDAVFRSDAKIIIPHGIVSRGEEMTVRLISPNENAALTITHNCFSRNAESNSVPLCFKKDENALFADIKIRFNTAGNTRLEFWANGQRIVRLVSVLDKGFAAVIPWVGSNRPMLDEELHRFDIAGDYWMANCVVCDDEESTIKRFAPFIKNHFKYGDRTVCFVNARTLLIGSETDSLFELDTETQRRGLAQLKRQMLLLGYESVELMASYTPSCDTIDIMEEMGIKGLTSLCSWQNWQDHGWKINHCGVLNQPYFPARDDFRRVGKKRSLMCFTMGNSSCNRNYSIMAFDACPTNTSPGERYLSHHVINHQIQRFCDVFDGYIEDSKNNENSLLTITVPLESFMGRADWNAANEAAIRYMARRAGEEKIVFTSAADIADFHLRKGLKTQSAYFFQPDTYYGFHNGTMPGRIDDRIEADTAEFLAVISRKSMLPMYFYDYTKEWLKNSAQAEPRNEFGLVDPDAVPPHLRSLREVKTDDMAIKHRFFGNILEIAIDSKTPKNLMVSGVFDVPFEKDFEISFDKSDTRATKIYDFRTGNTHLFLNLGEIKAGKTTIRGKIKGSPRTAQNPEDKKDALGAFWLGSHAYLRSLERDFGISVEIPAPCGSFVKLISGERVLAQDSKLSFTINTDWFDEAPILYGFPREEFQKSLGKAKISILGKTKCSRYSGQ